MDADLRCPILVGRDSECATVVDAISGAAGRAGGSVVVLTGDAGIGKSRLAREAAEAAQANGMPVVEGRARAGRSPAPLLPIIELVTAAFQALRVVADESEVDPYRPALARLVPTAGASPSPDTSAVVLAEGVLRLVSTIGALVIVEDLHWADPETLMLIDYLAGRVASVPVVLLLTLRADEQSPASVLTRAMASRGCATVVELHRLDEGAVDQMAAACLGLSAVGRVPAGVASLIRGSADGVPLLVEDLLAAAARDGSLVRADGDWQPTRELVPGLPATFSDTVRRRVSALTPDAVRVVHAAAVLGQRFSWPLLPAVTGLDEPVVLDALRSAIGSGLIVTDADGFSFRHALTAAAVAGGLLPPERAALSERAAAAVEALLAVGDDDSLRVLAADLRAAAGDRSGAARLLLAAGRRALGAGAVASATMLLDRACGLAAGATGPVGVDVQIALLEAVAVAGDAERTGEVGPAALSGLADRPSAQRCAVHLLMARGHLAARPDLAALDLAAARAAAQGDSVALARVDALASVAALQSDLPDRVARARALATGAVAAAEAAGLHEVVCESLEVIGRCSRVSDLDAAEAAFARQLQVAKLGRLELWRIRAQNELGTMDWLRRGDTRGVQAAHDAAVSAGALLLAAGYAINLGVFHTFLGDYPRAIRMATECEVTARRFGATGLADSALLVQAMVAAHRGDRAGMTALIERAGEAAGGDMAVVVWGICHAVLALVEEDRPAAMASFERADEAMRRVPALMGDAYSGVWLVVRLVDGSADERDLILLDRHAEGTMLHRLCGGVARAILAGRAGKADDAAALLAEGLSVTQAVLYRHLLLRLAAEAALADGWGDPALWLVESDAWFVARGHLRVSSACRRLLRTAGVVIGRRGSAEAAVPAAWRTRGITAREAEVLALIGDRLTNREIGERLFLSARTVEKHVLSLRVKFGAGSRSELGSRARANG